MSAENGHCIKAVGFWRTIVAPIEKLTEIYSYSVMTSINERFFYQQLRKEEEDGVWRTTWGPIIRDVGTFLRSNYGEKRKIS